jgi:hypothetical protein
MYGKHYGYQTSVSNLMISHFEKKVKRLKKLNIIKPKDKVLDIGSNDASFLEIIGKKYNLWGIDPSAKKFKKNYNGMTLIPDFFSEKNIIKQNRNKRNIKGVKKNNTLNTSFIFLGFFCEKERKRRLKSEKGRIPVTTSG